MCLYVFHGNCSIRGADELTGNASPQAQYYGASVRCDTQGIYLLKSFLPRRTAFRAPASRLPDSIVLQWAFRVASGDPYCLSAVFSERFSSSRSNTRMLSGHTGRQFELNLRYEAERQKPTDTCCHRCVRPLLVLFGLRFPSLQPGRLIALPHRFYAIHIGDQSVDRPSRVYAHSAPGSATTSRFRSDDHSRRRSCTRLRTFPLRNSPLGSWQRGSRHG